MVVKAAERDFALPLACRIHEGLRFNNRDQRTLMDILLLLLNELCIALACYFVADAYYATGKIIRPSLRTGQHLITAVKSNAVAYEPVAAPATRGRGRPRHYGRKHRLKNLFDDPSAFTAAGSPIYGEKGVTLRYRTVDLLWRPVGPLVRFVAVIHPHRGCRIFLATDVTLGPLEIHQRPSRS